MSDNPCTRQCGFDENLLESENPAIFDVLTNVEAITCKLVYIVIHEQKVKQLSSQCIKFVSG